MWQKFGSRVKRDRVGQLFADDFGTFGGLLCLVGVAGRASVDLQFQYSAIVAYALVFPFVCLLLTILFTRRNRLETHHNAAPIDSL